MVMCISDFVSLWSFLFPTTFLPHSRFKYEILRREIRAQLSLRPTLLAVVVVSSSISIVNGRKLHLCERRILIDWEKRKKKAVKNVDTKVNLKIVK